MTNNVAEILRTLQKSRDINSPATTIANGAQSPNTSLSSVIGRKAVWTSVNKVVTIKEQLPNGKFRCYDGDTRIGDFRADELELIVK